MTRLESGAFSLEDTYRTSLAREPYDCFYPDYYVLGRREPHYPLPVTGRTQIASTSWTWLVKLCPQEGGPCLGCITAFINEIEWLFFLSYK